MDRIHVVLRFALLTAAVVLVLHGCSKDDDGNPVITQPEPSIGTLILTPNGIMVSQSSQLLLRLAVPADVRLVDSTVKIVRVNSVGQPTGDVVNLVDNGDLGDGDEIIGDNIYSGIAYFLEPAAGAVRLRATGQIKQTTGSVAGASNIATLTVYSSLTSQELGQIATTQNNGVQRLDSLLGGNPGNLESAMTSVTQWLQAQPGVTSAERGGKTSIGITYSSGLYGGIIVAERGPSGEVSTKGGASGDRQRRSQKSIPLRFQTTGTTLTPSPSAVAKRNAVEGTPDPKLIGNRNVLIFAPFETYFAPDMRPSIEEILAASGFDFSITSLIDQQATVSSVNTMPDYGLIIIDSHGSRGKEFGTGEIVDTNAAEYQTSYKALLKAGKLAIWTNVILEKTGRLTRRADVYAIRAPFITDLARSFPNSVLFNGSCESTMNSDLETAFRGKGVKTYYGFNKVVNTTFCAQMADTVVKRLSTDLKTTGEAFIPGRTDPQSPNAAYEIKGDEGMRYPDTLVNGDFEYGTTSGWTKSGDGRVISRLGSVLPTEGSYMGIISTGLGFTTDAGAISQTFTIAPTQSTLSLRWNFLSEEFLEYIGSRYQDFFEIAIKRRDGTETLLLQKTIDGLAADFGATAQNPGSLVSVSPGIVFDQGGVYMTGWQTATYSVSDYRGQRITLILRARDIGDSIYDTAILLDAVAVK